MVLLPVRQGSRLLPSQTSPERQMPCRLRVTCQFSLPSVALILIMRPARWHTLPALSGNLSSD